ncbi:hypothetical protein B0T11DRAFT_298635 [Plectosphaerella cucumerina]|uniref:Uncharacterized protein n=1 Tax=Plectosphaerella cucumerina TaxID=40658 RepID=A0A8K0X5D4_9PEZI|nr:hypothetical protein B0T11DRAFT_298635 [Plectosphaerella cucumerina]
MCHGHPRHHACSHTSINWHYCPAAVIDLSTGVETPCRHITYAAAQSSSLDCPLQHCQYKAIGGSWTCCQCNHGPNHLGWCSNFLPRPTEELSSMEHFNTQQCAHGCCERCTRTASIRPSIANMMFPEMRKGTASRKFGRHSNLRAPHRRSSAMSARGDVAAREVTPGGSSPLPSRGGGPSMDIRGSSRLGHDFGCAPSSPAGGMRKHKASADGPAHGAQKHKLEAY